MLYPPAWGATRKRALIRAGVRILLLAATVTFAAPRPLNPTNPSVTICTPADGSTVSSPVHVVAGTTDSNTVQYMQIYLDGVKVYEVLAASLDTNLTMSAGAHRLTVQAKDSTGMLFKATINITVSSGTSGSVTVSPATLTFPSQTVNATSSPQNVTLSNNTTSAVTINGATASGDFAVVSSACGSSLAAGASCTISVAFTPTAAGTRTGTLSISNSAGTQRVSLTGTPEPGARSMRHVLMCHGRAFSLFGPRSRAGTLTNAEGKAGRDGQR